MTDTDPLQAPRDPQTEAPALEPDGVPAPTTPSTEQPAPGEGDEAPNAPTDPAEATEVVSGDADVPPGGLPD
jgi:hypothetical protein